MLISIVKEAKDTDCKTASVSDVIASIQTGEYRSEIEAIRAAWQEGYAKGGIKGGKAATAPLKKKLPGALWSGTFYRRANECLEDHSGLICADLDHLGDGLEDVREKVIRDPLTFCAFVSPTGAGLKVVFRCDPKRPHIDSFRAAERYVKERFGWDIDPDCKDVARLCFLSWDPDIYYAPNVEPLPYPTDASRAPVVKGKPSSAPGSFPPTTVEKIRAALQAIPPRPPYMDWLRISSAVWSEVSMEEGTRLLMEWSPEEKAGEYADKYRHKLAEIGIGTLFNYAKDHGYRPITALPRKQAARAVEQNDADTAPGPRFPAIETEPAEESILPDSAPIVADLVEPGDKVIIASGSKSYKTWLLIQLALCISMGLHWLGFRTIRTRVLFLNFEIKPRNFWRRVYRIRAALNLQKSDDFQVWNLRGKGFNMDDHRGELIERAKQCGAGVIILDPIYKLFGDRNESSAGDMATLMTLFDRVATETGAAIVFSHHFAKGTAASKDAVDRASGSGVFARDPDCILTLTRLDEAEGKNTFAASVTLRDFPAVDDFAVRREHPIMVRVDDVNVRNLHEPAKRLSKYTPEQVVGVLPAAGATIAEWQRLTKDQLGMSRSTFYDTYATPAKKLARFTSGLWHKSG